MDRAVGITVGVVLLVSVGLTLWVELLFPHGSCSSSVDILRTGLRQFLALPGRLRNAPLSATTGSGQLAEDHTRPRCSTVSTTPVSAIHCWLVSLASRFSSIHFSASAQACFSVAPIRSSPV